MKTLKTLLYLSILVSAINGNVIAQSDSIQEKDNRPVRSPFNTNVLIDNPTVVSPFKGTFNLLISHRFGSMENGISDIFGIYGGANTRLGLDYGITDRIMVGIGSTANYQLQDIQWKYAILQQTRSNSMPLSLSYYGNMVIDARSEENFGPEESYKFIHRLSYFTELIVSRKFNEVFSFQVAPAMSYYNGIADTLNTITLGASFGGKVTFWGNKSIIVEYDLPFTHNNNESDPTPNLGLGFEIASATHAFQIFVSNYKDIIYQRNLTYNQNKEFQFGFNITVKF